MRQKNTAANRPRIVAFIHGRDGSVTYSVKGYHVILYVPQTSGVLFTPIVPVTVL